MLADLSGKIALITGGGQGIGEGITTVLAEQGADVVIADIVTEGPGRLAKRIESMGRKALVLQVDVRRQDSVDSAVQEALGAFGGLDILVNNAGISSAPDRNTAEDGDADWEATFAVNVMGAVHCCTAVVPHMKGKRYGKIINVASIAGHAARRSGGAYGVSKAGVLRYTKGLAHELAPFNINVNAICPAAVWTPFQQDGFERRKEQDPALADVDPHQDFLDRYSTVIPMGRPQNARDIANAVAFLVSEDARNITGQCLHVDGGAILRD